MARTISALGNAISPVALAFAVLDIPGNTAAELGLVMASYSVTQVVLFLVGGVIADRIGKIRIMIGADIAAFLAQASIATLILAGSPNLGLLLVLSALSGAASALFLPASSGILPEIVPTSGLRTANSLLRFSTNSSMILGTAIAGVLVALVGSGWALFLDALSFLLSALFLIGLPIHPNHYAQVKKTSMLADLKVGWKEFTSRQWVWVIVCQFAILNGCYAAGFGVLGPVIAHESLGGALPWSFIASSQAAGLVAGSLLAVRFKPRHPMRVAVIFSLGFSVPLLFLGLRFSVPLIAVAAALCGMSNSIFTVIWDTSLQSLVPKELLSRVYAYDWLGSSILSPLTLAVVGPLSGAYGVGNTLLAGHAVIVAVCLAALASPGVWRLTSMGATGNQISQ